MQLMTVAAWALVSCAFVVFGAINGLDTVRNVGALLMLFTCAFAC